MTGQLFVESWILLLLVGDWLDPLEYVQWLVWRPCFTLCRVVSCLWVEEVLFFCDVVRCGLWWRDCSLCCVVSVCLSSSPIVLPYSGSCCFFGCLVCVYRTLSNIRPRRFLSSPVPSLRFVRFVPCMYSMICLLFALQLSTFTRWFAVPECNVWKDRQFSCNRSRSYSIPMAGHGTSFSKIRYVCHVTCVVCCVSSLLLCSSSKKYILTHTRCSVPSSQCMNEWYDSVVWYDRQSIDDTDVVDLSGAGIMAVYCQE